LRPPLLLLSFFLSSSGPHRALPSFPTRRSSDLGGLLKAIKLVHGSLRSSHGEEVLVEQELKALTCVRGVRHPYILSMDRFDILRSEEHTSELQSLTNLVCRLLLEKKKKTNNTTHPNVSQKRRTVISTPLWSTKMPNHSSIPSP